jgi:hypothetical protein
MIKSIFAIIFFTSFSALAGNFSFEKETCAVTVTNDVLFEINQQNFRSQVKAELLWSGSVPLPKIRLTFLQHEPMNATIEWKNILLERGGRKFLRPEMIDRIRQEDGQSFKMKRLSPEGQIAIYETEPLDLVRSQDLVALFLSQNEFVIGATTQGGDIWRAKQSLSASDASFRQMAATCYPQLSSNYLKPTGERLSVKTEITGLSPAALAISDGYGLTGFTWMEELLPTSLRVSNALAVGVGSDESKITQLVGLLREKQKAQEIFSSQTTNPDYLSLNEQLAEYYNQLTQVYSRFVIVTGNSSQAADSLIGQKIKEQKDLSAELEKVSAQIEEYTNKKNPLEQEYSAAEEILVPHMQKLASFDSSISEMEKKLKDIDLVREHFLKLLDEQQAVLGEQASTLGGEITAPWAIGEIEAKAKENSDRQSQIQLVSAMKIQVESIASDAKILLDKATAQQAAAQAYLDAVNQQRVRKDQLAKEELWLRQNLEVPHFTIASDEFFLQLNKVIEQQIVDSKSSRDYNGEFDTHAALYDKAQADFMSLVEKSRQGGASLFASVLCNPNVLMDEKNRTRPCLTIDEILNEKISDNFFMGLAPKDLDMFLTEVQKPWTQDSSKSQILIDRLKKEISQPTENLQVMVDAWGSLRHIIWRWVTMQKEAYAFDVCLDPKPTSLYQDKLFTSAFYEKVFQCEKAEVLAHQQAREAALVSFNETHAAIDQANQAYDQADAEFSTYSDIFMINADKKIKSVSENANFSQLFTSCLLPMERAEACSSSLETSVTEAASKLSQEQAAYEDMTKALFLNIKARLNILSNETSSIVTQTRQMQQGKQDYIAQNSIDILMANKVSIKNRLDQTTQQITDLLKAQNEQAALLAAATRQESLLKGEAKNLVAEIQSISAQITGLLPEFEPFCAAILPSSEKMQSIDSQVYTLFGKSAVDIQTKPYSSCQLPSLDHFIPNQDFLSPTIPAQR